MRYWFLKNTLGDAGAQSLYLELSRADDDAVGAEYFRRKKMAGVQLSKWSLGENDVQGQNATLAEPGSLSSCVANRYHLASVAGFTTGMGREERINIQLNHEQREIGCYLVRNGSGSHLVHVSRWTTTPLETGLWKYQQQHHCCGLPNVQGECWVQKREVRRRQRISPHVNCQLNKKKSKRKPVLIPTTAATTYSLTEVVIDWSRWRIWWRWDSR